MAFLTAEQAKQKANESEAKYRLLRHKVFTNIECAAAQGRYKLEVDKNAPYALASRLIKELKKYGYMADFENIVGKANIRFSISWKY